MNLNNTYWSNTYLICNNMIFTNYFIPGDYTLVKLINKQERVITNTHNSISNDESKHKEILEAGFYEGCTENDKYLNLFEQTGVVILDKDSVLSCLRNYAEISEKNLSWIKLLCYFTNWCQSNLWVYLMKEEHWLNIWQPRSQKIRSYQHF